jgi:hypothetical protein
MRGIERVITGVLLAAAICGSAAFARSVGRDAAAGAGDLRLTVAPPQHAQSPHGVRAPLYPVLANRPTLAPRAGNKAPTPSLADAPVLTIAPAARVARVVRARPAADRPGPAPSIRASKLTPKPHPASRQEPKRPAVSTPAAPAQPAETEPRILARVPLTRTPTWEHVKATGHGRLKNRPDDDDAAPAPPAQPQTQQPGPPPSATITIVVLSPPPPSGDAEGGKWNGNGNGNGNGHGHAYGRLKQASDDHD